MRGTLAFLFATTLLSSAAGAATVMPLDRATILAGSAFDVKVEFSKTVAEGDVSVTVNGRPAAEALGKPAEFLGKDGDVEASAVRMHDVVISAPGTYTVEAKAGDEVKRVTWDVVGTPSEAKAKNIIFLLGDGLSVAHRTGARLMSKGMTEGKANGRLAMDDLDHMAFVGTSATNSIATDSANTMSSYMTGHKSAINALGVYADRTKDSLDDPKVETIAEALRRTGKKAIGVVSTAEIEDATPAAVVAHTRKRADKAEIAEMFFWTQPDVILGGGSAYFLPQSTPGSKRKDDKDLIQQARDAGYAVSTDKTELEAAVGSNSAKLLGLFHPANMDTILDRQFLGKGTVDKFPNQPGLVEMTQAALTRLSKNPDGFFLMVEGASIDKMSHPMDWDRALMETIEFDKAVGVAREFQKSHPDTLIVATGDHTHGISIIGTIDDNAAGPDMRDKVGVYDKAGFPNYKDENNDGYPDDINVSKRLAVFSSNFPDYYETWRPKMNGPFEPAVQNEKKEYVANEAYKNEPGATLRIGNLPRTADTAVHAVDDVVLQASGPGAEEFKGYMEESDIYRVLADTFALAPTKN
ncbi:alkaline phosphatase [Aureimonas psammosilenae]|uniref:alkaline phosphatase n=1 Tax=Aureimonas psammosilenae TaxID=2495496 RepID=UPI001260A4E2|nr:alkaline phosphatase [Aureimonas psammosilenae]